MKIFNSKIPFKSFFIHFFTLTPLLFCACGNSVYGEKPHVFYMSIAELYRSCMPNECGKDVKLEGKEVHIRGFIDRDNVFDKKSYPQLPYEKFRVYDKKSGKSIEVWTVSNDNSMIFNKIKKMINTPAKEVFISGVVSSFDMPIMGNCQRGIKIEINNAEKIFFK